MRPLTPPAPAPRDRPLSCIDCKGEFLFAAGEQEFYEKKGFREIPRRCKPCRETRKARRTDGAPPPQRHPGGAERSFDRDHLRARPTREMFDTVCASCGSPARVPFRPASGRPVYCRECYSSRQGQGSGYGGGY